VFPGSAIVRQPTDYEKTALDKATSEDQDSQMASLLGMMFYLPHVQHHLKTLKETLNKAKTDRQGLREQIAQLFTLMQKFQKEVGELRTGSGWDLDSRRRDITEVSFMVR
jgi:hypothetical protein